MPLSDILSQDRVVHVLQRAYATEKLHHAWILTGPSGVGKTKLALEMGKLLVCERPTDAPDACGVCKSCRMLSSSGHPDVLVVEHAEGKSRIGVGQIRAIRARLDYPPHGERGRAVIFEKAEEMTEEAQNALLKTLEEPGSRTYLFLTTVQPNQLLPTILSRCSRLDLSPLPQETLESLILTMKPNLDAKTLALATSLSSGSVTAALDLSESGLDELTGRVEALDAALARHDVPDLLRLSEEMAKDKQRLTTTLELLALWYRDVLFQAAGVGDLAFNHRKVELDDRAAELGTRKATDRIEAALQAVTAINRRNANPRLTTESMLLRMLT